MVDVARRALIEHSSLVGNAAAQHTSGRAAHRALEEAREQLAAAIGAQPGEVVFTAGGSEADAMALTAGLARSESRRRVVVGATEHVAVRQAADRWPQRVAVLDCDRDGQLDLASLDALVDDRAALVSVMTVNNETGTMLDLAPVVARAREHGVWAHSDAVQALGHVPLDFAASGLDLMSLSAHKVGGPVGIGALVVRRGVEIAPWGLGGRQEGQVRSGTQPVMLAAAFAAAATHAVEVREVEMARLAALREKLVTSIRTTIQDAWVNGGEKVGPAILNVTFDGARADDLLLLLDQAGFDCSTGSACHAGVHQPSDVLLAMGRTVEQASSSIRFSFAATTTADDLERLATVLPDVVSRARAAASWS